MARGLLLLSLTSFRERDSRFMKKFILGFAGLLSLFSTVAHAEQFLGYSRWGYSKERYYATGMDDPVGSPQACIEGRLMLTNSGELRWVEWRYGASSDGCKDHPTKGDQWKVVVAPGSTFIKYQFVKNSCHVFELKVAVT